MAVTYTWDHIDKIAQYPHLLGHLAGKDKLTEMHSVWIKYLWFTKADRSLWGHRGSYKTTAVMEIGVPLWLAFNPDHRIAIVRKTYTAAADIVRAIANIMESPLVRPFLEKVWGTKWKFSVKREGRLTLSVKTTNTPECSIEALGLDSNWTGKHFDRVFCDDFIDLNDRISDAERERTKMIIQEIRANIIDRGNPVSFLGTPWAKHDCWEILPPALKFPVSKTGLISLDEITKIKQATTPLLYACNYDLYFESEDDLIFKNPRIGTWQTGKVTNVKAHIDAAFEGEHWNALTIMANLPGDRINAVGFVYAGNMKDWIPFVIQKMVHYGVMQLYIETNADKGYTADFIRKDQHMRSSGIWIEDYDERMNKDVKIQTYFYETWPYIEWASETMPMYLEMCTDYREKQEPNDAPDSAASLCREGGFSITKAWMTNPLFSD